MQTKLFTCQVRIRCVSSNEQIMILRLVRGPHTWLVKCRGHKAPVHATLTHGLESFHDVSFHGGRVVAAVQSALPRQEGEKDGDEVGVYCLEKKEN